MVQAADKTNWRGACACAVVGVAALAWGACSSRGSRNEAESPARPRLTIDPTTTGSVGGSIRLDGAPPARAVIHMDQDPACVAAHHEPVRAEDGSVNADGSLPDVFVYVKRGAEDYAYSAPAQPVTLDQVGCVYKPHVLGLRVGQVLRIVTSDPTTHNVHALARDNREWNESQLPGAAPIEKTFTHPEVMIPVKCNDHPWMKAYVGVVANPFFAVTGAGGRYALEGLPPGDFTIEAWSAVFGTEERNVTVSPHASVKLDFTFRAGGSS